MRLKVLSSFEVGHFTFIDKTKTDCQTDFHKKDAQQAGSLATCEKLTCTTDQENFVMIPMLKF